MSIAHLLEDFSAQASGVQVHLLDEEALEEHRLAAFEHGYKAGWEDALTAQEQSLDRTSAALAASLEDMSFTYHEALNRMSLSLEPMFEGLVRLVLPETLERGFGTRLVEQLCELAGEQIGQPMQILVPVGQGNGVGALVPPGLSPPPKVIEDSSLEPGTARLLVGMSQQEVDCNALLASISNAFDAYLFEAKKALSNE